MLIPPQIGIMKIVIIMPIFKNIKLTRLFGSWYCKLEITPRLCTKLKPLKRLWLRFTVNNIITPAIREIRDTKNKMIIILSVNGNFCHLFFKFTFFIIMLIIALSVLFKTSI